VKRRGKAHRSSNEGKMDQRTVIVPREIASVVTARWPREVVVEHSDGTVSLFSAENAKDGVIRARRAGDRVREEMAQ
jgi:hypothetical protein